MDPNFSLMKIDICKWRSRRWGRIEPKSKLTNKNFSFILDDPIIEFFECGREVWRGKYSSISNLNSKWLNNSNRKVLIWERIDKTISIYILKIDSFGESLSNREGSSLIL